MCKLHEILYEKLNKWIRLLHIINILYDFEIYVFQIDQILRQYPIKLFKY